LLGLHGLQSSVFISIANASWKLASARLIICI
jgi:hypothetical protein